MSDGTKIEWTDATWNPVTGCSVVSPGCTNCYAMRLAGTRLKHPDWARSLRDQCQAAGVAFFMKQMTMKAPIPDDLMIRELPDANTRT